MKGRGVGWEGRCNHPLKKVCFCELGVLVFLFLLFLFRFVWGRFYLLFYGLWSE